MAPTNKIRVIISVGSNINPIDTVKKAQKLVADQFSLITTSTFVFTKPIGFADQADFYNGVFLIETNHTIDETTKILKEIEQLCGRKRTANKNGPRTIDLDIAVWDMRVVDNDVYSRQFLKDAILEVLPDLQII